MSRRMFSPQIIDSDAFLDMPTSSQNLYFHLGMRADDDGFVGNPKKILRMIGGVDDDLKILIGKRFVLVFESGVIVIKHWRINNLIRKDWYRPTIYQEEMAKVAVKDNGAYTESVNVSLTKPTHSIGKVSIVKDSKEEETCFAFGEFWDQYPRHEAKQKALKKWETISETDRAAIKAALPKQKVTDQWTRGFVPHATTYLNGRRWEDEIAANTPQRSNMVSPKVYSV